jgi:tetratricopeptide (TPR) repeat protein
MARRYAHRDSIRELGHARALLASVASESARKLEIQILERISDSHYALGEMAQSAEIDRTAAELATAVGMKAAQVDALTRVARALAFMDPDACVAVCERAAAVSKTHDDPLLQARTDLLAACWRVVANGWRKQDADICAAARERIRELRGGDLPAYYEILYAHVQSIQGEYLEAYQTAEAGIPKSAGTHSLVVYLSALSSESLALLHLGRWGELRQVAETAIDMATKNGNDPWLGIFRAILAWLHLQALDLEGARRLADDLLRTHLEEPPGQVRTMALLTVGFVDLQRGSPDRALKSFTKVRDRDTHPKFFLQWYWRIVAGYGLASACLAAGDLSKASEEADLFLKAALATADPALHALAWETKARLAVAANELERAREHAESALKAIAVFEPPPVAWRVHATAADICARAGDRKGAERHSMRAGAALRQLSDSFQEKDPLREMLLRAAANA